MTHLDSILKSRDITLLTNVHLVKSMVFPVVMYDCESWTMKKAEHRRIGAFDLWCWRRLLRVPWTARRSNQSILKEISPDYSLEGLMLKLKLQYFGYLIWKEEPTHWKRPWCWERLKAGGEGDDRGQYGWMASPTQWIWVWASSGRWWRTGNPGMLQSMGSQLNNSNNPVGGRSGEGVWKHCKILWKYTLPYWHGNLTLVCVSCSVMSDFGTPWTVAHQAPLSMGFPRQEYWSELPFLLLGSSWLRDRTWVSCIGRLILLSEPPGKPHLTLRIYQNNECACLFKDAQDSVNR